MRVEPVAEGEEVLLEPTDQLVEAGTNIEVYPVPPDLQHLQCYEVDCENTVELFFQLDEQFILLCEESLRKYATPIDDPQPEAEQ